MSHASTATRFDFRQCVAYDPDRKRLFHRHGRRQLRLLAEALCLVKDTYDLRSNAGGIRVGRGDAPCRAPLRAGEPIGDGR